MALQEGAAGGGEKKRVVIVGGGCAGGLLAKSLQFNADVILIDPKEYFEISWASLRAVVEPTFAERTLFNHIDYFTNGRLITSRVVNITHTEVLTSEGLSIAYDYLIIATGHDDSVPKTRTARLQQYREENEKVKSASSILILGGGPTGVELAGELSIDFPEKKVTLIHRGSRLLEFIGTKASKKALNWLISKKVEVILDQSVDLDSVENKTYLTSSGETIKADCHFLCTGKPTGSSWLKETMLGDKLDSRGRLMVDEHLRVKGRTNVFAIGDITDTEELKQGYLAQKHALLVAKNIKLLMKGGDEQKMITYKPAAAMALVSLGRKEAVAQFPFTTIIGCIPGMIKSKDLFVGKTRKEMGLTSHSV
ncbi:hypothetical protein GIB67_013737 [Kingdonia uniflora]|uniref:FAD/NAD(P)-binding domain-containing protein n=1 Tax=Kingdonia uniflora TaxID=39325 RepID=A0A7J7NQ17_9MAGN|nr:hypothetical protein GIB67_013737 [Kingdonia uniflora]